MDNNIENEWQEKENREIETVKAKTLLSRNKSTGWFGCEFNMNIYRGCNHGCLYCDSRSDCYQVGRFDTVRAKENALMILRNELSRKAMRGVVATGAMSDPYNPFEVGEQLTRHALELLSAYQFGVAVATKSDTITRDIDVFKEISSHSPVLCKLTITTPDNVLAAKLEPGAPPPERRFKAMEKLSAAGIFTGVLLMPVLPFIEDNDESVIEIVEKTGAAGGKFIYPAFGVTMRAGQREYLLQGLEKAFPGQELAKKYNKRYNNAYYCASPKAKHLWHIFAEACKKARLLYEMRDIVRAYRGAYGSRQMSLFDAIQ